MKDKNVRFHNRKNSGMGLAGFILAVVCLVFLLLLCLISATALGNAGEAIGVAGLLVAIGCLASIHLCIKGMSEKEVYTRLPFAGMILSGAVFVLLFCFYISGL